MGRRPEYRTSEFTVIGGIDDIEVIARGVHLSAHLIRLPARTDAGMPKAPTPTPNGWSPLSRRWLFRNKKK